MIDRYSKEGYLLSALNHKGFDVGSLCFEYNLLVAYILPPKGSGFYAPLKKDIKNTPEGNRTLAHGSGGHCSIH